MKVKICYTKQDLKKAEDKAFKEGVRRCERELLSAIEIILQDRHGWNADALHELEKEVSELLENVLAGNVTVEEIVEAKREEIG